MAKFEVTWEAPEFEYREKGVSWYWISIIAAAIIIAFSVWIKNFLFGLFIVIAEVLFIVWGNREPNAIAFRLDENALTIGEHKSHSLKEFESWSAEGAGGGWSELLFYFKSKIKTPLMVLIPEEKLDSVRVNLKTILREVEHQASFLDSIEKLTRF